MYSKNKQDKKKSMEMACDRNIKGMNGEGSDKKTDSASERSRLRYQTLNQN